MFLLLLTFLFLLIGANYYWRRRRLYAFASTLDGPFSLPLIGCSYLFFGPTEAYLQTLLKAIKNYKSPIKFWLGPDLLILFDNPKHIEKILLSNKITHKHDIYNLLKTYAGEGLITSSGPKWKAGRKLIQPLFNAKFVSESLRIFSKHARFLINKLDTHTNGEVVCVKNDIQRCVIDIIGESMFGVEIGTQFGKNEDLRQAMIGMYNTCFTRIIKPWLHPDFTYYLTHDKQAQNKQTRVIRNFFTKVAQFGKSCYLNNNPIKIVANDTDFEPSLLKITKLFHNNNLGLTEKDLIDNLFTLFAASEDTIAITAASACVCFGMYPEYQEKAIEEIKMVLSDSDNISYEDILKLTYMDMCIKEVLRLFPIAPFIMRKTTEDFEIDKLKVPAGCAIVISIFNVHLDPTYWQKPMEFHPDHFLPEFVEKRPTFCYIPFSAGPRGCIGKIFAQISIKLLMVHILRNYVIEADGNYAEIFKQLKADISVRLKFGYKIRIKRRTN